MSTIRTVGPTLLRLGISDPPESTSLFRTLHSLVCEYLCNMQIGRKNKAFSAILADRATVAFIVQCCLYPSVVCR